MSGGLNLMDLLNILADSHKFMLKHMPGDGFWSINLLRQTKVRFRHSVQTLVRAKPEQRSEFNLRQRVVE